MSTALNPKISLEQWRALVAVVDAGGYAQAAETLHKTQSSVSYLVAKLERSLNLKVFEIEGRKAKLTDTGQVLVRRARALIEEADSIERAAGTLAAGWEPELAIAAEIIFPTWMLLRAFARFGQQRPQTRIQLHETVLTGTDEALIERRVHLAIASSIPRGFIGDRLLTMRFICAAHPDHPLHQLGREITQRDLRRHRHLIVRDSAAHRMRDSGIWQGAEQRLTVSNMATSIAAAVAGMGFAWYSEDMIRDELHRGVLKPLPLKEGAERRGDLFLVLAEGDAAGPGARLMAEILREEVKTECAKHV
ncbi:MAG: LysR family transcriptional regulator [Hydrocarboniphaga sp.]|uniref:LysR family transcriptional regulator n=1 Tax=Hydrocarboniphaga sp. TaxID=2033016 RepID=UPI00262F6274|nr:LysR family transcriptional regulator [Hydrocarboniphaga sp.]MDB5972961.1 LysR family transcriptional regulator [Hydrocarboniphaga sp.]